MKSISLFAGVGGFDLGMEKAGHTCVAQVEWDKKAAGVLKRRWPDVPLFCDVSKVTADDLPDCDFITYGFPCQDLSVASNLTVRRLTAKECERLQGFPDDWTSERAELALEGNEWKAAGKVVKQADGPRYKQMGNAVTVNVSEWLGRRLGEA